MFKDKKQILALAIVGGFFLVVILLLSTGGSLKSKLDDDPNFNYQTSMTSEYNSREKADVYLTVMTVNEAVDYISKHIQRPLEKEVIQPNEMIKLRYSDDYLTVYRGKEDETYVQRSSKKYHSSNGGYYRSYHMGPVILMDDFGSSGSSKSNSGGGSSARSDSVGSRPSIGGGTSFGK